MKYIGVKVLRSAKLTTRAEYIAIRGWKMPEDEDPNEEVYMVEYEPTVDNKSNLEGYEGYVTMSPKLVFEEAYRPMDGMTFGLAIEAMKKGSKIARAGWNGSGMWLKYEHGGMKMIGYEPNEYGIKQGEAIPVRPYFELFTAQKDLAKWSPSGSDALAEDWLIVE